MEKEDFEYIGYVEIHTKNNGIIKCNLKSKHLLERLYMNYKGICETLITQTYYKNNKLERKSYKLSKFDIIGLEKIHKTKNGHKYKRTYVINKYKDNE